MWDVVMTQIYEGHQVSIDFGCALWPQDLTFHPGTAGQRLPKEGRVLQQAFGISGRHAL